MHFVQVVQPDIAQVPRDPVGRNFANYTASVSAVAAGDAHKAGICNCSDNVIQDIEGAFLLENLGSWIATARPSQAV